MASFPSAPSLPDDAQEAFELGCTYQTMGWPELAESSFRRALELDPFHGPALRKLGDLLWNSEPYEALHLFEKALEVDPSQEDIALAVTDAFSDDVPQWHFPMMNDEPRNQAFAEALKRHVVPGSLVLDIGTGSGLLSMMAVGAGASLVYTCEEVPSIADVARDIVDRNGFSSRIRIVEKNSSALHVGSDLPRRADLLVTETVDNGLLGEGILATTRHARRELLKPGARIIPQGAQCIAVPIDSETIYRHHSVGTVAGFDLRPFNRLATLRSQAYDLRQVPHQPLSSPTEVFSFRFGEDFDEGTADIVLPAQRSGTCHGIAYWMRLFLDEKTVLDTGPWAPRCSFEQPVQLLPEPVVVEAGQTLRFRARHNGARIWFGRFSCAPPSDGGAPSGT